MDFRNAIKWYQYDPTKWFIWVASKFGLASHLKVFPKNEIQKGMLTQALKTSPSSRGSLVRLTPHQIHEVSVSLTS